MTLTIEVTRIANQKIETLSKTDVTVKWNKRLIEKALRARAICAGLKAPYSIKNSVNRHELVPFYLEAQDGISEVVAQ